MANPSHMAILRQGADAWNQWRQVHPDIAPDLKGERIDAASFDNDVTGREFNFSNMTIEGVVFAKVSLRGVDFSYATLNHVSLISCDLSDAKFEFAQLRETTFAVCDGTRSMNFLGASATDCAFREFEVKEARFSAKEFRRVVFEAMSIVDGSFQNGHFLQCKFIDTSFRDCSLAWADLSGSLFEEVEFRQTDFFAANLSRYRPQKRHRLSVQ